MTYKLTFFSLFDSFQNNMSSENDSIRSQAQTQFILGRMFPDVFARRMQTHLPIHFMCCDVMYTIRRLGIWIMLMWNEMKITDKLIFLFVLFSSSALTLNYSRHKFIQMR